MSSGQEYQGTSQRSNEYAETIDFIDKLLFTVRKHYGLPFFNYFPLNAILCIAGGSALYIIFLRYQTQNQLQNKLILDKLSEIASNIKK
jgi:hypothetical protein